MNIEVMNIETMDPGIMKIPTSVARALELLAKHGHSAYVVGGCVRDSLMGKEPKDYDIATSAVPQQIKHAITSRTGYKVIETGIKHGTVTALISKAQVEITSFRLDGIYTDGRRPDSVSFAASLVEDLSRRDFTINALAYSPDEGYQDPFGGIGDILAKKIRGVGDPMLRFEEDALRILRAIRFRAQLGFEIEGATLGAMVHKKEGLSRISAERIRDEITKILMSDGGVFLELLDLGFWDVVDPPSLPHFRQNFDQRLVQACDSNLTNRLAMWLYPMKATEATRLLKRLSFPNLVQKNVGLLLEASKTDTEATPYAVRKAIGRYGGAKVFQDILYIRSIIARVNNKSSALAKIDKINRIIMDVERARDACTLDALAINGDDLLRQGAAPGKHLGQTLHALLDIVQRDPTLNTRCKLLSLARELHADSQEL